MAMAYVACPDKAKRQQIKKNIKLVVDQMRECQERTFVFDKELGRYREARDLAPEAELQTMGGLGRTSTATRPTTPTTATDTSTPYPPSIAHSSSAMHHTTTRRACGHPTIPSTSSSRDSST